VDLLGGGAKRFSAHDRTARKGTARAPKMVDHRFPNGSLTLGKKRTRRMLNHAKLPIWSIVVPVACNAPSATLEALPVPGSLGTEGKLDPPLKGFKRLHAAKEAVPRPRSVQSLTR